MSLTPHNIVLGGWFVLIAVWLAGALTTKRSVRRHSGAARAIQTVLVLMAYFLIFDPDTGIGFLGWRFVAPSEVVEWTGAAIALAGLLFALWARIYIGRNWSSAVTVKEDHELIQSGPYTIVRHPIYTGLLLAIFGTALEVGKVRGVIGFILATIGWRLKSFVEEQLMSAQFGAEYAAYKSRVKALVPFIW